MPSDILVDWDPPLCFVEVEAGRKTFLLPWKRRSWSRAKKRKAASAASRKLAERVEVRERKQETRRLKSGGRKYIDTILYATIFTMLHAMLPFWLQFLLGSGSASSLRDQRVDDT